MDQEKTLRVIDTIKSSAGAIALTILCHPSPSRIGDFARLTVLGSGERLEVNRFVPVFRRHDARSIDSLATMFASRSPLVVEALRSGAVRLCAEEGAEVVVEGEVLSGEREYPVERLRIGLVLMLGNAVVLLLHILNSVGESGPDLGLVGESDEIHKLRSNIRRVADLDVPVLLHGETGVGKELVARAIHECSGRREREYLCVNKSDEIHKLRSNIRRVADLDVPVLLHGETGVGKELVARAIHECSGRREREYLCVNMAAVTSSVAASELFGHKKSAFTGASRDHEGYFQRADKGTLFLDEIGDASHDVQLHLLRAVETGQIQVVGGDDLLTVDVRLVAATDSNLDQAIEHGRFRLPLLQRLAGYEIHIPPLRSRRDDIGRLFVHFLRVELDRVGDSERLADPAPGRLRRHRVSHVEPCFIQSPSLLRESLILDHSERRPRIGVAAQSGAADAGE
jgi:two-component system nitrogen regulation response regulator GlnG